MEKNLDLLIKIWQKRNDCELWLAGDGPYQNGLKAQLPKAKFFGYLSGKKLSEIYASADFFVFPSATDTFGNAVLEAQACGTPVITTKEGSLPEVSGDSAYYVDAFNYESIANGIKNVFEDEKLQEELREKGFENTRRFSWKKTALETLKVYESI